MSNEHARSDHSRRTFLERGATASILPGFVQPHPTRRRAERSRAITVAGDVVDVTGRPVPGIAVQITDVEEHDLLASAESNADGRFELQLTPPDTAILRAHQLGRGSEWFTDELYASPRELEGVERLTLDHQLLFGPTPVRTDDEEGLGMVTLWRRIDPADNSIQTINLEVNEIAYDANQSGLIDPSGDPPLEGGTFSLAVPESVDVAYGPEFTETTFGAGFSSMYRNVDRERSNQWLPNPQFPLYRRRPRNYPQFTRDEMERERNADQFWWKLIGILASGSTVLGGTVMVLNTLGWVHDEEEPSPDVTVGDEPTGTLDPNRYDTVSQLWFGDSSSVLFQVPVNFDANATETIVPTAVWRMLKPGRQTGGYDLYAKFTKELAVGATEEELRIGEAQSRSEDATVTGTIRKPDGSPAAKHTLVVYGSGSLQAMTTTDEEGRFAYERPDVSHDVQYYQVDDANPDNGRFDPEETVAPEDGSPDLFALARLHPGDATDLGILALPEASPLDLRVVDQNGEPIGGAGVDVTHFNDGATAGLVGHTDESGRYDPWASTEHAGIEVDGTLQVRIVPPEDGGDFRADEAVRDLVVTDSTEMTVTLEREGQSEAADVTGRILQHDGSPASKHTLVIYRVADKELVEWVTTDQEGYFSYDVDTSERYDIQYYQVYDTDTDNNRFDPGGPRGPRDGVPDMFALVQHEGPGSLGTFELPQAYPLDVRVVDQDGDGIQHARVTIEHSSADDEADAGLGPRLTNGEGYFVWGTDGTGLEVRGEVTVVVQPPEGSNNYEVEEKERDVRVTESTTLEVTLPQIDP